MKKIYLEPEMEITKFNNEEVMTNVSGGTDIPIEGDGEDDMI